MAPSPYPYARDVPLEARGLRPPLPLRSRRIRIRPATPVNRGSGLLDEVAYGDREGDEGVLGEGEMILNALATKTRMQSYKVMIRSDPRQ